MLEEWTLMGKFIRMIFVQLKLVSLIMTDLFMIQEKYV